MDARDVAQQGVIAGRDFLVEGNRIVVLAGHHHGVCFLQARHGGVPARCGGSDMREGLRGEIGLTRLIKLLSLHIGFRRFGVFALIIDAPELKARNADHEQAGGGHDVVAIFLPNLLEALSAYLFLDFLEDVAHGYSFRGAVRPDTKP